MKEIAKKVFLMFLVVLPITSVSFAAQSVLNAEPVQDGSEVTSPSVSWTNGK